MKHYHTICQSVRGESHIRRGIPKEDAAKVVRFEDRVVAAVSDGHGDPRCMRSQVGAHLAVNITLDILRDWDVGCGNDDAKQLHARVTALAHEIIDRWNLAVETHFKENPLTEAELQAAGNMRLSYVQGKHISHIYGATLIALMQSKDTLFFLQKGDGRAVMIDSQGRFNDQVIPWDDRCYLNVTTSLCDPDAPDTFTYRLLSGEDTDNISAVMLGSDGVEDSFANSDLMNAYYGLLATECIENGEAATEEAMLNDLAEMSKYGSKDDISVVGLIDPETIPAIKPVFERMQKLGTLSLKFESSTARFSSMAAAFTRRLQQLQAKQKAFEAFKRNREIIELNYVQDPFQTDRLKQELESIQLEIDQRNAKEQLLQERVSTSTEALQKTSRALTGIEQDQTQLLNRIEHRSPGTLPFLPPEHSAWVLELSKFRQLDLKALFADQERKLKHDKQELEDWQKQTQTMELRKIKLAMDLENFKLAQQSRDERNRKKIEARIKKHEEEEDRLKRELFNTKADFEAYEKKYEAAKLEREQLLTQIEQLKRSVPTACPLEDCDGME